MYEDFNFDKVTRSSLKQPINTKRKLSFSPIKEPSKRPYCAQNSDTYNDFNLYTSTIPHSHFFRQQTQTVSSSITSTPHISKIPNTFCHQAMGCKKTQQDAYITEFIKDFETLSHKKQQEAIESSCQELQLNYGQYQNSGSTLALCISYGKNIVIANIGDSLIYSIKRETNQNITQCKRLNTLHRHDADGKVHKIEVTHAIGDTDIDNLSHDPEILFFEADDNDILLMASDGLTYYPTNKNTDDQEYISQLFESDTIKKLSLKDVPKKLKEKAIADGSRDNISIILNQINSEDPEAKIFVICDGHGLEGEKVSTALTQNLLRILNNKVQQLMFRVEFK